jgi:Domain of unknown function (DUF5658)
MSTPTESSIGQSREPVAARSIERRRSTWHALWAGSFERRRRGARRGEDRSVTATDWHHPQWLAVTILILLLCSVDAILTLTLIDAGGTELNPFMRSLLLGDGRGFAFWKLGLTSAGVVTLVLLARLRAFGRLPVGPVLYVILAVYSGLVSYEFWLLNLP